jgi:ubiquinone/menaquinone biosynthesis C-methylase UbiE
MSEEVDTMAPDKVNKDMHVPAFTLDNPIRGLFDNPDKYCEYVSPGQVVADLGCGPGFYSIPLAKKIGPQGRVYAVDSDRNSIHVVERKVVKNRLENVETHHTSASNLSFIPAASVDFVLADGLLCTMAIREHFQAVAEINRILKVGGRAELRQGLIEPC